MELQECKGCGCGISWNDQRRQFGRLMKSGKTKEQVTELMPRCQKCATEIIRMTHGYSYPEGVRGEPKHITLGSLTGSRRR